ncbi:hypothetical protein GCM10010218_49270 [Streptomyces mashuensis]|uniref:Uncharacterized protein n=1 Tax=Streptomyces mashuensis TaxID=33904 RepID=A0A919EF40_9ACTN|nr:hypothetical protein GCM10010218_49270 [Streptomyces mashuensis]
MIRGALREGALYLLGVMDERWYGFYQWALVKLHEDPSIADCMYDGESFSFR